MFGPADGGAFVLPLLPILLQVSNINKYSLGGESAKFPDLRRRGPLSSSEQQLPDEDWIWLGPS